MDVDGLVKLPMLSVNMKKDQSIQVSLPCPECESLEKSMCEVMVGDFSFSDSDTEEASVNEKYLHNNCDFFYLSFVFIYLI